MESKLHARAEVDSMFIVLAERDGGILEDRDSALKYTHSF